MLYHKLSNIYAKKVCLRQTEGPFEGRFIAKTRSDVNYLYGFTCVCYNFIRRIIFKLHRIHCNIADRDTKCNFTLHQSQ